MSTKIENRLDELRQEFASGQKMLAELEQKKLELESTMLRISGAIQVLEELVKSESEALQEAPQQPEPALLNGVSE